MKGKNKNKMNKNSTERKYRRSRRLEGAATVKDKLYDNYNSTHVRSTACFVPMHHDLQRIPGYFELGYAKHEVHIPPLAGNLHHLSTATNYVRITEGEVFRKHNPCYRHYAQKILQSPG
jgi:hypothetical protein